MEPPRKSETSKTAASRAGRGKIIAFLEKNRGKPQYRPTPSAGMAVNRILRPLSKKFGPGATALQSHWPQIVGEEWARLSRPDAVRSSKDGKTLIIIAQGPAAMLIQANSGQLLDKINQFLGASAISKLRVQQGNIPTSKVPSEDEPAENHVRTELDNKAPTELKKALNRLGNKIKDRETR